MPQGFSPRAFERSSRCPFAGRYGVKLYGSPVQVLRDIGYSTDAMGQTVSIMAAGGILRSPVIAILEFNCLGQAAINFPVVAMNVPFNPVFNGILGMDFMTRYRSVIDLQKAEITLA